MISKQIHVEGPSWSFHLSLTLQKRLRFPVSLIFKLNNKITEHFSVSSPKPKPKNVSLSPIICAERCLSLTCRHLFKALSYSESYQIVCIAQWKDELITLKSWNFKSWIFENTVAKIRICVRSTTIPLNFFPFFFFNLKMARTTQLAMKTTFLEHYAKDRNIFSIFVIFKWKKGDHPISPRIKWDSLGLLWEKLIIDLGVRKSKYFVKFYTFIQKR